MKYIVKTSNGVESTLTQEQWDKSLKDPRFKNTFTLVKRIEKPAEVKEAEATAAAAAKETAKADKSQEKLQDKK